MMIRRKTPFAPGAARELLRSTPEFMELVGDDPQRITTRELPDPLRGPCVTIYTGVNRRQNIELSKPRLIVSVWVPAAEILVDQGIDMDPEELSWDVADLAGRIFDRHRQMGRGGGFEFRGVTWRSEWDAGPTTMVDRERGAESPLYRSVIEILMKVGSGPR